MKAGGIDYFRGRIAIHLNQMGLPHDWKFLQEGELNGYTIRITNGKWNSAAFTITDDYLKHGDIERAAYGVALQMTQSIPPELHPAAPPAPAEEE